MKNKGLEIFSLYFFFFGCQNTLIIMMFEKQSGVACQFFFIHVYNGHKYNPYQTSIITRVQCILNEMNEMLFMSWTQFKKKVQSKYSVYINKVQNIKLLTLGYKIMMK